MRYTDDRIRYISVGNSDRRWAIVGEFIGRRRINPQEWNALVVANEKTKKRKKGIKNTWLVRSYFELCTEGSMQPSTRPSASRQPTLALALAVFFSIFFSFLFICTSTSTSRLLPFTRSTGPLSTVPSATRAYPHARTREQSRVREEKERAIGKREREREREQWRVCTLRSFSASPWPARPHCKLRWNIAPWRSMTSAIFLPLSPATNCQLYSARTIPPSPPPSSLFAHTRPSSLFCSLCHLALWLSRSFSLSLSLLLAKAKITLPPKTKRLFRVVCYFEIAIIGYKLTQHSIFVNLAFGTTYYATRRNVNEARYKVPCKYDGNE